MSSSFSPYINKKGINFNWKSSNYFYKYLVLL